MASLWFFWGDAEELADEQLLLGGDLARRVHGQDVSTARFSCGQGWKFRNMPRPHCFAHWVLWHVDQLMYGSWRLHSFSDLQAAWQKLDVEKKGDARGFGRVEGLLCSAAFFQFMFLLFSWVWLKAGVAPHVLWLELGMVAIANHRRYRSSSKRRAGYGPCQCGDWYEQDWIAMAMAIRQFVAKNPRAVCFEEENIM